MDTTGLINIIKKYLNNNPTVRKQLSGVSARTHKDIEVFQCGLAGRGYLNGKDENIEKHLFQSSKDSADIWFGSYGQGYELIIEIDATRADQVAKKMLSRFCYSVKVGKKPLIYVALLYKGTASMNPEECKKYFQMGATVLRKLNKRNILIGYIIGKTVNDDEAFVFDTPNRTIQYNDVLDRENYVKFLYEENIKSIENYSMPLNKIEASNCNKKAFLQTLMDKNTTHKLDFISRALYSNQRLSKDQKSYWNMYIKFLS